MEFADRPHNRSQTIEYRKYAVTKLSREDLIVYIILATIGMIIPSVIALRHFFGIDPLSLLHIRWGRTVVGTIFTFLATGVCLLNFYLSDLSPWFYKRKHGSMVDYAHISGLPVVGGILIFFAGALMTSSVLLGIFLLLLYVIDGNGIPRFFFSILRS